MPPNDQEQLAIQVCADWQGIDGPIRMGTLFAAPSKGKEVFSFEYEPGWLSSPHTREMDPDLDLYAGPQYTRGERDLFGVFLDSCPDRWGQSLMRRREEREAWLAGRKARALHASDYLLGVHDSHRMGALRFRFDDDGPFLDDREDMAVPPWAKLRELEHASRQLEAEDSEDKDDYAKWLALLIAPGSPLGGARPKANVSDEEGRHWIAKFPSRKDEMNVGKWEYLVHQLAGAAGIEVAPSQLMNFSGQHDTFLTRRFDRTADGGRLHFASAMTMLGRTDGDGAAEGVSYLDLADFLVRRGAEVDRNLEQLWRRIVFSICVSNTDDHLRNHGFMLVETGWVLSPAYDMNPEEDGAGLSLNISRNDNDLDLELAKSVARYFRIKAGRADTIIEEVKSAVRGWSNLARELSFSAREASRMERAFSRAE